MAKITLVKADILAQAMHQADIEAGAFNGTQPPEWEAITDPIREMRKTAAQYLLDCFDVTCREHELEPNPDTAQTAKGWKHVCTYCGVRQH